MPKTFTADIGDVRFPNQNFVRPLANTGTAEAVKEVVQLGLEVDTGISSGMLRGGQENPEETLVVGGIPIEKGVKLQDPDAVALATEVEGELSLRKVKRMRDQGVISASAAKILAAQSVQAATARRPGLGAEFRKTASAFFGDFGEGQGTLDETAAEKKQASELAQLRLDAIKDGFVTYAPDGSYDVTPGDFQRYFQDRANKTAHEGIMRSKEVGIMQGQRAASLLTSYAKDRSLVHTSKITGLVTAQMQQFGSVAKPELIDQALFTGRRQANYELGQRIAVAQKNGAVFSPTEVKSMYDAMEEEFKTTAELVKNKSWQEVNKRNAEGIKALTTTLGTLANPTMAALEAVVPGSSKHLAEITPKLMAMTTAQRQVYFSHDPWAEKMWNAQTAAMIAGRTIEQVGRGLFPDFKVNPSENAMSLYVAANMASTEDGQKDAGAQGAINGLEKEVAKGNIAALRTLLDPKVRPNITPESKQRILRATANAGANLLTTIPSLLADLDAYELQFDGKDFIPALSEKGRSMNPFEVSRAAREKAEGAQIVVGAGMAQAPRELKDAAAQLNLIVRGLYTYGGDQEGTTVMDDPVFQQALKGKRPEEYGQAILDQIKENQKLIKSFREKASKTTVSKAQRSIEEQLLKKQQLKEEGIQ
jgi:hypothetical protein